MRVKYLLLAIVALFVAIFASTNAQAQGAGAAFWSLSKNAQCNVVRRWSSLEPSKPVAEILSWTKVRNGKDIFVFRSELMKEYFGKEYASLSKKERKKLHSLVKKCSPSGTRQAALLSALDTGSGRRGEYERRKTKEAVARLNSKEMNERIAYHVKSTSDRDRVKRELGDGYFLHDEGYLIFENDLVRLFWPKNFETVSQGPCKGDAQVHVELKRGRDFIVTREILAEIYDNAVRPTVRKECGSKTPTYTNTIVFVDNVYLYSGGEETSRETLKNGRLPEGHLASAYFTSAKTYSHAPDTVDIKYSAEELVNLNRDFRYEDYFRFVGSVNKAQDYLSRGRKTPEQFAQAQRKQRQNEAFRAANPGWPSDPADQDAYIEKGNFAGMMLSRGDISGLSWATFYLDAYSKQCAARSRYDVREIRAVRTTRSGQSATYLPFRGGGVILNRPEYESRTYLFATIREDQWRLVDIWVGIHGRTLWQGSRNFQGNSEPAKLQRQRVAKLGCDTPAMRSYERKLMAFAERIYKRREAFMNRRRY